MNPKRTLVAYLYAKPEKREALLEVLTGLVSPTRSEPGCADFHFHVSDSEPNTILFYENWKTQEALDFHSGTSYLKAFSERRMDYLEKEIEISFYTMYSDYDG